MTIKESDNEHMIFDVSSDQTKDTISVRWDYRGGSQFLLVLSNALESFDLDKVLKILAQGQGRGRTPGYWKYRCEDLESFLKVAITNESTLERQGYAWEFKVQELRHRIPYRFTILLCETNGNDEIETIYKPSKADEGSFIIPLSLDFFVTRQKIGILNSQWYGKVHISKPDGYTDGAIVYNIPGTNVEVPLTSAALGRDIYIALKDEGKPVLRTTGEAGSLYKLIEKAER